MKKEWSFGVVISLRLKLAILIRLRLAIFVRRILAIFADPNNLSNLLAGGLQEISNFLYSKQFISHAQGSSAFSPSRSS